MKTTACILLALSACAQAISFDTIGFGQRLNGWREDRTALYSLTDGVYRTHVPTITGTPGGGMFLSTQIEFVARGSAGAICHLELTFSSSGALDGAQVKGKINGMNLDSGLVRRPQPQPVESAVEGEPLSAPAPRPGNPTDEMVAELFTRFDTEFQKVTESKGRQKRDLFSRISSGSPTSANIAAGLRHNLNLILQHVNRRGSAKSLVEPAVGAADSYDPGTGGSSRRKAVPHRRLAR